MSGPGPDVGRALTCLIQDSELFFGERLGSGSFGVVKRAEWHTPTGRVVGLMHLYILIKYLVFFYLITLTSSGLKKA